MLIACPACGQLNRLSGSGENRKPVCGACRASLFTDQPITLTADNFSRHVRAEGFPVLVDFWASWCGPCHAMAPVFAAAAGEYRHSLRFAKVDTEAEQPLAERFGIRSIPTLILFRDGRESARVSGALPASELRRWIAQAGFTTD